MTPPLRFRSIPVHNWDTSDAASVVTAKFDTTSFERATKKIAVLVSRLFLYVLLNWQSNSVHGAQNSSYVKNPVWSLIIAKCRRLSACLGPGIRLSDFVHQNAVVLFLLSKTYRKHIVFPVVFNLWTISLRRFWHSKVSLLQEMPQCCGTVVGPGHRSALWRCAKGSIFHAWHLSPFIFRYSGNDLTGEKGGSKNMAKMAHSHSLFHLVFLFPNLAFGLSPRWPMLTRILLTPRISNWALHTSLASKMSGEKKITSPKGLKFYLEIAIRFNLGTRTKSLEPAK